MPASHNIHASLLPLSTLISKIKLNPHNARMHDERNVRQIARSLDTHQQLKPIIVRKTGNTVIAGNGTLLAAKRLEWTHIAALYVDSDKEAATALGLEDNRTAELAAWDFPELISQWKYLQGKGLDLAELGWEPVEFESFLSFDKDPADKSFDPVGAKKKRVTFTAKEYGDLQKLCDENEPTAEQILTRLRTAPKYRRPQKEASA